MYVYINVLHIINFIKSNPVTVIQIISVSLNFEWRGLPSECVYNACNRGAARLYSIGLTACVFVLGWLSSLNQWVLLEKLRPKCFHIALQIVLDVPPSQTKYNWKTYLAWY